MVQDLNSLPIEQKVGQLFFIGIHGTVLDAEPLELLETISPGGVCLFSRNIREAQQTRDLLDGIRRVLPVVPFLSIDQEGGLVDRLRRVIEPMPAADKIASEADAGQFAEIIAETLLMLGFNMNFAPVVDVAGDGRKRFSNGLASRTFGDGADEVTLLAGAFLTSLQQAGILGCLKHFPGLGASQVDSHEELPTVDISETEFNETDLHPYHTILGSAAVEAVMVAHAAFPGLSLQETDQNGKLLPSSLSYNFVTNLLRGKLAFERLVITDDLEMGAIIKNYGIGDACKRALTAGSDLLAICANPGAIREGYTAVLEAVKSGEIGEGRVAVSLDRIAAAKVRLTAPPVFVPERLTSLSRRVVELNDRLGR